MGNGASFDNQRKRKLPQFLSQNIIDTVDQVPTIYCVRDSDTVSTMLNELCKRNITATPVYSLEFNSVLGMADLMDVTSYLVAQYRLRGSEVFTNPSNILQLPVKNIMEKWSRNRFLLLEHDTSVIKVAQNISKAHVNRVAIMNDRKEVTAVVTQSTILRLISDRFDEFFPEKPNICLSELGYEKAHFVRCVSDSKLTILAYEEMIQHSISCMGIVDVNGKLIGCLSSSHLKGFHSSDLNKLLRPVKEFITSRYHQGSCLAGQVLTAPPEITLKHAIDLLLLNRYHHLFLIDPASGRPLSVISLHDLIDLTVLTANIQFKQK